MILTDKLTALGDAIREKTGTTESMTLDEMATVIEGITIGSVDIPEDLLVLTGDQSYKFCSKSWQSFLNTYGEQMRTENLTSILYMFQNRNDITEIPFSFNSASAGMESSYAFENCSELRVCPNITGTLKSVRQMFYGCQNLPNLPDFSNIDVSPVLAGSNYEGRVNAYCYSIRSIPMAYYKQLKNRTTSKTYTYSPYYYLAYGDYNVDEIIGMPVMIYDNYTSNAFNNAFASAYRLKDFTFEVQADGSPYIASKWKSQTIDLTTVGYCQLSSIYDKREKWLYNSGIAVDKCIYNDTTYQALKNDPDNYVCGYPDENPLYYSRYNKASAIRTINSLPDVSGSGGTNTIKFKGLAGLKTDNGAINTMTEEEIAVATAKGWTITFV